MSGHLKRRLSECSSAPEQRKAMRRDTGDSTLPTLLNGSFRIHTDLRSQSKAEANDPRSPKDWRKLLESIGKRDSTDAETAGAPAEESSTLIPTTDTIPPEQVTSDQLEQPTTSPPVSSDLSEFADEDDQDERDSTANDSERDAWDESSTYDSEYDEFHDYTWLEQMDGKALWEPPEGSEAVKVGSCSGKLIRRSRIRDTFHDEMEEPSTDTSELGFDLFDRYGRLKPEFKTHPVKKGSGVWQDELDDGDLLLIDYLHVKPPYRRHALGRQLFTDMFEIAQKKTRRSLFAVVQPGYLVRESDAEMGQVSDEARKAFYHQAEDVAHRFWRQIGFRRIGSSEWFGLASDPSHACRRLEAGDDYDPRVPEVSEPGPVFKAIRKTLCTKSDEECIEHFKNNSPGMLTGHSLWEATDEQGNALLHIAGSNCKPSVVKWILQENPGSSLLDSRNNDGDTPLDALLVCLEAERTQRGSNSLSRIEPRSDRFKGFSAAAVECLAALKGMPPLSDIEKLRFTYGCTCGTCKEGFFSPRMSLALLCQAEVQYDMLLQSCSDDSGPVFVDENEDVLQFLQPSVRQNLATNKSMRQGFVAFFDHFATSIKNKVLPTETFMLQAMRDANEWPPVSRNFLERGGTVYSVGSMIFELARSADRWAGDGDHWAVFEDQIKELPACRNDHEFGFASSMCGFHRVSGIRYVSAMTGQPITLE